MSPVNETSIFEKIKCTFHKYSKTFKRHIRQFKNDIVTFYVPVLVRPYQYDHLASHQGRQRMEH